MHDPNAYHLYGMWILLWYCCSRPNISQYHGLESSGGWGQRLQIYSQTPPQFFCTIFYKKLVKLSVYFKKVYKGGFAGSWRMIGRLLIKILLLYIHRLYIHLISVAKNQWICCLYICIVSTILLLLLLYSLHSHTVHRTW